MSTTSVQPDAPSAPVVAEPEAKPSVPKRAPKPKPKPRAKSTAKPKPAKPGKREALHAEHPWLPDAVRSARRLSGMKPGSGGDATLSYAGPGQHLKVREHVTKALGGNVTPDGILGLTGIRSHKLLREIASWSADKSEMVPMRALSAEFRPDAWAQGRYLAAILCAWTDQLRAEAKSAKKSS